jgi:uncharacterized membrane protein YhiD involved in acid resistance
VALGSCTFTQVGYAFAGNTGDSARVAAQIVAGIGFLGAGMLLRGRGSGQEMTTTFTIWLAAAVRMTFGAGYAGAALGPILLTGRCPPWSGAPYTVTPAARANRESLLLLILTTAKR